MTKEQNNTSQRNRTRVWKLFCECGAIPNNGKKYCLHHWDESLRHTNIERYIQWNLYDIEVMEVGEHRRFHMINMSQEHRTKLSEATKRYWEDEVRRNLRKNQMTNGITTETRKKMSEARKGKSLSEITRMKLSKAITGIKRSEETRKKISESVKRYWQQVCSKPNRILNKI